MSEEEKGKRPRVEKVLWDFEMSDDKKEGCGDFVHHIRTGCAMWTSCRRMAGEFRVVTTVETVMM